MIRILEYGKWAKDIEVLLVKQQQDSRSEGREEQTGPAAE